MSEDSKLPVPIPDTFDLKKIEQDLAKYRLDQNALASYVSGLTKRFKADQQLKKLEKLFQFYDIAIQYKDKEYKFKEKQHDLSLLDLKKQQEKEQLEAGIERARTEKAQELKKQRDLLQPRAETQPQPKKDALQEYEEEARFESRKKIINAKIEAETNEKIKEIARNDLENSTRSYETYVKNTKSNPNLSEDAKKEMIRLREQILIKELDELERRL